MPWVHWAMCPGAGAGLRFPHRNHSGVLSLGVLSGREVSFRADVVRLGKRAHQERRLSGMGAIRANAARQRNVSRVQPDRPGLRLHSARRAPSHAPGRRHAQAFAPLDQWRVHPSLYGLLAVGVPANSSTIIVPTCSSAATGRTQTSSWMTMAASPTLLSRMAPFTAATAPIGPTPPWACRSRSWKALVRTLTGPARPCGDRWVRGSYRDMASAISLCESI